MGRRNDAEIEYKDAVEGSVAAFVVYGINVAKDLVPT